MFQKVLKDFEQINFKFWLINFELTLKFVFIQIRIVLITFAVPLMAAVSTLIHTAESAVNMHTMGILEYYRNQNKNKSRSTSKWIF